MKKLCECLDCGRKWYRKQNNFDNSFSLETAHCPECKSWNWVWVCSGIKKTAKVLNGYIIYI